MSRSFAPAPERLRSVIAREKLIGRLLQSSRENLANPPRMYTELALEQLPGIVSFFQKDVPGPFKGVDDATLLAEFRNANQSVIDALNSYATWLKSDLLPRSNGDFRIGAENYRKKLLYDEMVDTPLDRLLSIAHADLRSNRAALERVASQIDARRKPAEILQDLEKRPPGRSRPPAGFSRSARRSS